MVSFAVATAPAGSRDHLLPNRDPHLYQNRLAITAPLVHA